MFSSLPTFRADLEQRLTPVLPGSWRIEASLSEAITALVPVVYMEFTDLSTTDPRGDLPRGQVLASVDLVIADPGTNEAAEDGADAHVLDVLDVLDTADDIYWESARKERLGNGSLAWRISCRAYILTTTA